MSMRVYYQNDVDPEIRQTDSIAIVGYGNQGRAHALNLRDSDWKVIVAQRPGGPSHARAIDDGFKPVTAADAAKQADILVLALPDESTADIYDRELKPHLRAGQAIGFLHGFNIRFERIAAPPDIDIILVAPKGPGTFVRDSYTRGGGLTCLVAAHQDATGRALQRALAWGAGIGGGRGGMIETTFAGECECDLFGEQTVLCGGVIELMKAAYDVLVEAGYPAELAYFECVHEVKQVVDLQYAEGFAGMRDRISNTAAFGGLLQGPRLVTDATRAELRRILDEIRAGKFADDWMADCAAGNPKLRKLAATEAAHPSEAAGQTVRNLAAAANTQ